MLETSALRAESTTDGPPKSTQNDNPLCDPLTRFAVFGLGGQVTAEVEPQGLSFVSYLTAKDDDERKNWQIDPETGEVTTPEVTFWEGGSLVKATRNKPNYWKRKPGKRGKVDPNFSKGARRRLMRLFGMLKRPKPIDAPLFVTLTAPGKAEHWQETTPEDWKRCLDTWWKRVKRAWPDAAAVWRLEPQKRGAPHFHLVIWGVWQGGIPRAQGQKRAWRALTGWVSQAWWEVWGSGDPDHLKAGTSCEVLNNWRRMMYYVSKYMAKAGVPWPEQFKTVGRLWGKLGQKCLPYAKEISEQVTDAQAIKIIRLMRKFAGLDGRSLDALTIFCDASFWHSKLSGVLC